MNKIKLQESLDKIFDLANQQQFLLTERERIENESFATERATNDILDPIRKEVFSSWELPDSIFSDQIARFDEEVNWLFKFSMQKNPSKCFVVSKDTNVLVVTSQYGLKKYCCRGSYPFFYLSIPRYQSRGRKLIRWESKLDQDEKVIMFTNVLTNGYYSINFDLLLQSSIFNHEKILLLYRYVKRFVTIFEDLLKELDYNLKESLSRYNDQNDSFVKSTYDSLIMDKSIVIKSLEKYHIYLNKREENIQALEELIVEMNEYNKPFRLIKELQKN